MNNGDHTLDSEGKVYMLIDVYDSDVSRRYIKGEKNYHNEMLVIEDGDLSVHDIHLSDKYTYDNLWLKADANDNLTMAGFFHETIDRKHKDGVYYLSFTDDFEVEVESYNFIPLELVNLYQKERVQKKNNKKKSKNKSVNISNMDLDKIYYQDDGSILLIGEKYYVTSHTYTDSNGNTHTRYVYHYEEILATKINADGELVWMKKLPKIQRGGSALGGMSYAHTYKEGNHYFFYLDNVKNIDLATNQKPATHADGKGGIFTVYKINDDSGKITKNSLFDMKEVTVQGKKKPLKVYQFNVYRVMETENGIAVEVYKKGKEDLMIQIGID